jgi:hypothetical protein
MIKKAINKIKKVFIPRSEFIDQKPKKVENKKPAYIGVVAPIVAPFDSWFSKPVKTEKAIIHEEKVAEQKKVEALHQPKSKEPENIHQKMYEMSTRSGSTTLQLNPIGGSENFQGGSENFHER